MSKQPEQILVITTSYPKHQDDSSGHFVKSEVVAMRGAGHEVTVVAAGGPHIEPGVHSLGGVALFDYPGALPRLIESPSRLLHLAPATYNIRHFMRRARPFDRVICHWLVPSAFPWGLGFNCRHKEVVVHGSDLRLILRLPGFLRIQILQTLLRRSFSLRFVSSQLKAELAEAQLPKDLIAYVESGSVKPAALDIGARTTRTEARKLLSIDESERWAVLVGRLIREKRPDVALRAVQLVPELSVAVIGSGPLETALRESYPGARFLGQLPHSETLRWIAAADILLAPSRLEGAPTVVREARALGTLVITAPSGDTLDWALQDKGIWVV